MADLVKYCPRRHPNDPLSHVCATCDEDISTTAPEPLPGASPGSEPTGLPSDPVGTDPTPVSGAPQLRTVCVLEIVGRSSGELRVHDGQTLGRDDIARVLPPGDELEAISRAHARFSVRRERWYVQNLSETNFIVVDRKVYRDRSEVPLRPGSELWLSETRLRVSFARR